jgi:hypothetical protein
MKKLWQPLGEKKSFVRYPWKVYATVGGVHLRSNGVCIMKKLCFIAACAMTLLMAGTSFAGQNGPNPKSVASARGPGGGSALGAAQLGGSYLADGTIIVGVGASGNAAVLGVGTYQPSFRRDLRGCVWTGSIGFGTFSGSVGASHISVTGRAGTTTALFVQTFDSAGALANLPFEIHVICG